MTNAFLTAGVSRPDFLIAAIGRSGSTMLSNWLSRPPEQLVFVEPFFLRTANPRLLRIQLDDFGIGVGDPEWAREDASAAARFNRIMAPRLAGRRWAFKEVLAEEYFPALDAFAPDRVVITVRDISDVALSLFEKHRLQDSLDRFDDSWVEDYCLRESSQILHFRDVLEERATPYRVARYEDFTRSEEELENIAQFVGWEPGGEVDRHMERFDRGFELARHGRAVSSEIRNRANRDLDPALIATADRIAERCGEYLSAFGYA